MDTVSLIVVRDAVFHEDRFGACDIHRAVCCGNFPSVTKLTKNRGMVEALNRFAKDPTTSNLIDAARALEKHPGATLYRRELWREMKTTALTFSSGGRETLYETAWFVREKARRNGRKPERLIVSRTLLVKGLEFDRAVAVDVDEFNGKEFYVAASRGRSALTVLSGKPFVRFKPVGNVLPPYP